MILKPGMFVLALNPMTGRCEAKQWVACAETSQELEALLLAEMVEPYSDGQWHKVFRRGGPLEWFNPPDYYTGIARYNPPPPPEVPHVSEVKK